jgi:hypothetical protein
MSISILFKCRLTPYIRHKAASKPQILPFMRRPIEPPFAPDAPAARLAPRAPRMAKPGFKTIKNRVK